MKSAAQSSEQEIFLLLRSSVTKLCRTWHTLCADQLNNHSETDAFDCPTVSRAVT